MRKFYGGVVAPSIFVLLRPGWGVARPGTGQSADAVLSRLDFQTTVGTVQLLLVLPFTFALWRVLPNRPVNAIYLRSFSHDADTGVIRTALQAALGRQFRLSGIRDPRRRW